MTARGPLVAGGVALAALLTPAVVKVPVRLVWNASASAPIGLYAVRPIRHPTRGMLLVLAPPEPIARLAADRQYLPLGAPLLKHVAALPGERICRIGARITLDGAAVGRALDHDGRGRPLPVWQGCRTIGPHEVFVMNLDVRDSFDGRYFGPLPLDAVLGRARSLWTEQSRDHDAATSSPAPSRQPQEKRP